MKRLVYSARRPEQPKVNKRHSTQNVKRVCNAMGWPLPFNYFKTNNGHRCRWLDMYNFVDAFIYEEAIKILCDRFNIDFNSLEPRRSFILDPYGLFVAFTDKRAEQIGLSWLEYAKTSEYEELNDELYHELRTDPKIMTKGKEDAEEALDKVYDLTGINCFLSKKGFLVVPFIED